MATEVVGEGIVLKEEVDVEEVEDDEEVEDNEEEVDEVVVVVVDVGTGLSSAKVCPLPGIS